MTTVQILTWSGVLFAGLAAILWGASSAVNIPLIGSGLGHSSALIPFMQQ